MELKDLVLGAIEQTAIKDKHSAFATETSENLKSKDLETSAPRNFNDKNSKNLSDKIYNRDSDRLFLRDLGDKTRLLFHGLSESRGEKQIELVISFLEYQLALIEERLKRST